MSRQEKTGKIATDGGVGLGQNPFAAALGGIERASAQGGAGAGPSAVGVGKDTDAPGAGAAAQTKNRGRVDVFRTTAGRGGKTVTVVKNFVGIGLPEKEALCKKMRGAAGCGGTVKDGEIEIQGDQREVVARVLREAGFRPVMAGG
jgi:translation initiation factor 1